MTTKYIFVLNILKLAFAADIEVSKFKFIGYRNVWHTGQDHRVSRFKINTTPITNTIITH